MFLFLLLFIISIFFFFLIRSVRFRWLNIPPGNLGLPFIGETLQRISAYKTENPEPFIDRRVNQFGAIFTTHVFGEPTVFSADSETNRFILQNEGKVFECSYPSSISNLLGRHSLLLMKGGLHKKMHSLTMSFANSAVIKDYLLGDIGRLVRMNLDSWTGRVLLMEEAKKITFEVAVKQLMSIGTGEWSENLRKHYVLLVEGVFTLPFPLLSPTYRRAIKARRKVADELRLVVKERRSSKESINNNNKEKADGGVKDKEKDMLRALLEEKKGFSDEEIVDFLLALLVAGYETTSTIMTLAVKFLSETPLALSQLKAEHKQIKVWKGESEALEWNDYKFMPFTQCVINETLRVANIIGGIFRRAMTDIHIKGYTIPKGWKIFASFRAVHLDHDNFNDAHSFNPWRWRNNVGATISFTNVFTPFGGGPRLCPGYELARVQLSVFLHHFVTRISWAAAEEDKLVFFPTTRTQKRYPINVQRIISSNKCKDHNQETTQNNCSRFATRSAVFVHILYYSDIQCRSLNFFTLRLNIDVTELINS